MLKSGYEKAVILKHLEDTLTRLKDKPIGIYSPSLAGLCVRKNYFEAHQYLRDIPVIDGIMAMHIGKVLHEDITNLFAINSSNMPMAIEKRVADTISGIPLIGSIDVVFFAMDDDFPVFDVWDIKSTRSLKKIPYTHHKLQVGTYISLLQSEANAETSSMCGNLLYINKISGERVVKILDVNEVVKHSTEYWDFVYKYTKDGLPLKEAPHSPIENWECNYCNYTSTCKLCTITESAKLDLFDSAKEQISELIDNLT